MPFEDIKGPLSNWVTTKSIQLEIKRRFRGFLEAYKDDAEELVYKKRVRDMCVGELTSCLKLEFTITRWHQKHAFNILSVFNTISTLVDASHKSLRTYLVTFENMASSQFLLVRVLRVTHREAVCLKRMWCLAAQQQSLLVDLRQLASVEMDIALWLQCQPKVVMELLNEEAKEYVLKEFPEYGNIHEDIFVRLEASIEENIRDLRCSLSMPCVAEQISSYT